MSEEEKEILPDKGIWTLEAMASYLKMDQSELQQKLTDKGIKVLALSSRYRHKLVSLESIVEKIKDLKERPEKESDEKDNLNTGEII